MTADPTGRHDDGEIREPDNSTVEDWMGQSIQRDADLADQLVASSDSMEEAEARFEDEADGQAIHEAGYPRPGDEDQSGDGPVGQPS